MKYVTAFAHFDSLRILFRFSFIRNKYFLVVIDDKHLSNFWYISALHTCLKYVVLLEFNWGLLIFYDDKLLINWRIVLRNFFLIFNLIFFCNYIFSLFFLLRLSLYSIIINFIFWLRHNLIDLINKLFSLKNLPLILYKI